MPQPSLIPTRSRICLAILAIGTTAILLLGGCASTYAQHDSFKTNPHATTKTLHTPYRLAAPDVVLVTSHRIPQISQYQATIQPDGSLVVPLVGSVHAQGHTCEEVANQITELARHHDIDADIAVSVVSYQSQRIYVFGEVSRPGPYPYHSRNTVLQALNDAVPTRLADVQRVQILRPASDGQLVRQHTLSVDDLTASPENDILLDKGDIVYVPTSTLAGLGHAFRQLVSPYNPNASSPPDTASAQRATTATAATIIILPDTAAAAMHARANGCEKACCSPVAPQSATQTHLQAHHDAQPPATPLPQVVFEYDNTSSPHDLP